MYKELLLEAIGQGRRYDEMPQPPCPDGEISRMQATAKSEFGDSIPDDYCDLLRIVNGFAGNNLSILGAFDAPLASTPNSKLIGFIERNRDLREFARMNRMYTFAEDSLTTYSYNCENGEYWSLDNTGFPCERFADFDGLMSDALRRCLL